MTMTTEECRQTNYAEEEITDTMICASSPGTNACNGDSGGPLVYKAPGDGNYYQIGLVSFTHGDCAAPGWPTVYTRLSDFFQWINNNKYSPPSQSTYAGGPGGDRGGDRGRYGVGHGRVGDGVGRVVENRRGYYGGEETGYRRY